MKTHLMAAATALGFMLLTGSSAFASDEGYNLKTSMASDLLQQFDAVASHHKGSAGYAPAMALRQKATTNIGWGNDQRAIEELRTALGDIHVYPDQ